MAVAALPTRPSLEAVNATSGRDFAVLLGPLFERAARFLARLAGARPFGSWDELFDRALEIARAMPETEQLELIDAHPRLGGEPSALRARSELSYREQGYGRDAEGAERDAVSRRMAELNEAYERRFGFRFVVFVAGRSRAELLPTMATALEAERDAEIRRALSDVVAIARDRRATLGWP